MNSKYLTINGKINLYKYKKTLYSNCQKVNGDYPIRG